MIYEQIKEDIKTAMKARDELKTTTLRGVVTEFTNELVRMKKKPSEVLDDDNAIKVIKKLIKQRKESIDIYEKAGRTETADQEKKEMEILQQFIPEQMAEEDVERIVKEVISEMGENAQIGQIMKTVMEKAKGQADGSMVSEIVRKNIV